MKLRITWEVDDGYCGKSRSQKTIIDTEEFGDDWDSFTEDEQQDFINESIQHDFIQKIIFSINNIEKIK